MVMLTLVIGPDHIIFALIDEINSDKYINVPYLRRYGLELIILPQVAEIIKKHMAPTESAEPVEKKVESTTAEGATEFVSIPESVAACLLTALTGPTAGNAYLEDDFMLCFI